MRSEEVGVAHPPSYPLSETLTHAGQWIRPISLSLLLSHLSGFILSSSSCILQYILVFLTHFLSFSSVAFSLYLTLLLSLITMILPRFRVDPFCVSALD